MLVWSEVLGHDGEWDLSPSIYAGRHDYLRGKASCSRILLPLLEKREEREGQPVGAYSIGFEIVVEVVLGDSIEVCGAERLSRHRRRLLEPAGYHTMDNDQ